MQRASATYCFTCAKPITQALQVHRSQDGVPCPGCLERAVESLPSLLPSGRSARAEEPHEPSDLPLFGSLYEPPPEPA